LRLGTQICPHRSHEKPGILSSAIYLLVYPKSILLFGRRILPSERGSALKDKIREARTVGSLIFMALRRRHL